MYIRGYFLLHQEVAATLVAYAASQEREQQVKGTKQSIAVITVVGYPNKNFPVLQQMLKMLLSWPNTLNISSETIVNSLEFSGKC
jgi:hypothetical protein